MRALEPTTTGTVARDGVTLSFEVYGSGTPTVALLPTWSVLPARFWKAQVPYLARHYRVVTWDGRGTGRSDRPRGSEAYGHDRFAADTAAVLDATGTDRAVLVAVSCGALWAVQFAVDRPERTLGLVAIAPAVPLSAPRPERAEHPFDAELAPGVPVEGWAKYTAAYWERDYADFLHFFAGRCLTEPHSTKQQEDFVGWGLETDAPTLTDATRGLQACGSEPFARTCARVRCPVLVVQGDEDAVRDPAGGRALAEVTGGSLVLVRGGGHLPGSRDPVLVNNLVREFVDAVVPPPPRTRTWTRALRRPRRVLYISSPIGLGHARRDVAIARELRARHPDVQIDWLAQHPVTTLLRAAGENIHPASARLASESAALESQAGEHDLHAFQAIRGMDDSLTANFMVFADLVREEQYDLWVGDEAWDVDYFLHENPELKTASFAWMTDFVGWLPVPSGGAAEAALTADYNAEMLEQRARFRRVRDRSIFIGEPGDVVPDSFGPGLPSIRAWTEANFDFAGYVTGFDPAEFADREALRAECGYAPGEPVCLVTVGGSAVGSALLALLAAAHPLAAAAVPGLRTVLVTGPRIDPASVPAHPGLDVRGYLPDLHRHLAACDLAVVQGGLTTCMELTATGRPFLYFPLDNHFEQTLHVDHRLRRHRAGVRMDYRSSTPASVAAAVAARIGTPVDYRPVRPDGAARAAELLSELL